MRIPDALMKPEITGWLRKFARKPRRSTAMSSSTAPESSASNMAAAAYSALPGANSGPRAAAVISETTATGPTARVRLVPNSV